MKKIESSAARLSWLLAIRPGDRVRRMLGGSIPIDLIVTDVTRDLILCGEAGIGWSFDRVTGAEVDGEIGWGPRFGKTGSYLVPPEGEVN